MDQIFIRRHRPVFCEAFIQINLKHAVRYTSEKPRFSLLLAFLDPKIYYAPEQLFRVTDKNSRRVYQLLSFIDRILPDSMVPERDDEPLFIPLRSSSN